ncbi:polysaccharide deacetylase family protein [Thermomonospora catenispora]|uniref:polysaccharide deacetylase family protein n=1 Tax=Thermomonospora catenispora TaxID=2493090 RepID=UPI001F4FC0E6|nr:polysaccharide deacetylase family protein [Thermomonospora catenispora]
MLNRTTGIAVTAGVGLTLSTALLSTLSACGHDRHRVHAAADRTRQPSSARPTTRAPTRAAPSRAVDCAVARCVALTFDDGPGRHTERLLDLLRPTRARVTFFVVGRQVRPNAAVVRRIVAEGHEIGNHTWSHARLPGLSEEAIRAEIDRTQDAVHEAAGVRPRVFRPPYAVTDARVGRAAGLPQVMWSVDPMDWRPSGPGRRERMVDEIVRDTRPGDIVLLHDVHGPTVSAAPELVTRLRRKGYELVTVSDLFRGVPLRPGAPYRHRRAEEP